MRHALKKFNGMLMNTGMGLYHEADGGGKALPVNILSQKLPFSVFAKNLVAYKKWDDKAKVATEVSGGGSYKKGEKINVVRFDKGKDKFDYAITDKSTAIHLSQFTPNSVSFFDKQVVVNDKPADLTKADTAKVVSAKEANAAVKSQTGVDLGKEGSSLLGKMVWFPYIGLGLGYLGAAYIGNKRNSSAWGYIGWMALGGTVGVIGGLSIAAAMSKKQLDAVGEKLDAASKEGSANSTSGIVTTGSKDDQIKASIDGVLTRTSKLGTKFLNTQMDSVLVNLTDKERGMVADSIEAFGEAINKLSKNPNIKAGDLTNAMGELQKKLAAKYPQKDLDALLGKFDFNKIQPNAPKVFSANSEKIKSSVSSLVDKIVQVALKAIGAKKDLALTKLTDKEKDMVLDGLKSMDKAVGKLDAMPVITQADAQIAMADAQKEMAAKYKPEDIAAIGKKLQPIFS